jgi:hypothetical protein
LLDHDFFNPGGKKLVEDEEQITDHEIHNLGEISEVKDEL